MVGRVGHVGHVGLIVFGEPLFGVVRRSPSPKFVGEIERATSNVSVAILWQLCDGLGVTMAEFFTGPEHGAADEVAALAAVVGPLPPAMRRRVLRIARAVIDE